MVSITFLLSFLVALISGNYDISQASSMTSVNPVPQVSTEISWDCGDETCWIIVDAAGVHTGP